MKIGGYREAFIGGENTNLHLRMAEIGRLSNISECLYFYRKNLDSVTFAKTPEVNLSAETVIRDALRKRGISTKNAPKLPSETTSPPWSGQSGPTTLWSREIETPRVITPPRSSARHHIGI